MKSIPQIAALICLLVVLIHVHPNEAFLMELVVIPVYEFSQTGFASLLNLNLPSLKFNSIVAIVTNPSSFLSLIRWDHMFNLAIWLLLGALSLATLRRIKSFLFHPINRIRLLGDVGYQSEMGSNNSNSSRSKEALVADVRKRRKTGDIPPVYPNGWFAILESNELKLGEAKSVSCLGKNLAVFRGEDGVAHVLDAYCPHMGANLAVGGVVKKNCLECPFHGWQFRGDDGQCVHVPYCEDKYIPKTARVNSYNSIERNGFILIWFHAEDSDPLWEPPIIDEVTKGEWKYGGRSEHIINAHIEEIPENGADVAHLKQVHGPIVTAGVDLTRMHNKWWNFARHDWIGSWAQCPDPDKKHIGQLDLVHRIVFFGKHFSVLDLNVTALQIGPGLVHLHFDSPYFGKGVYIQTLTPIEPLVQRVVHQVYVTRKCPIVVAKFFLYVEALMIERDIMIWNNKQYLSKPLLLKSKEDALVGRHRRWYSQFYSEHSPRIDAVRLDSEW